MDVTTLATDEVNCALAEARWTVGKEHEDHDADWWSSTPSFDPPAAMSPWSRLADVEPSRRLPVTPNANVASERISSEGQTVLRHSARRDAANIVTSEARQDAPDVSFNIGTVRVPEIRTVAETKNHAPDIESENITQPPPTVETAPDNEPDRQSQLRQHLETLRSLSRRAASHDQAAIDEIQLILNTNDDVWRHLGNVERTTEAMLVEFLAGPPEVKESVRRTVAGLKRSLLTADPTALESMAVGRVVACWLFTQFVDRWCGFAIKDSGRTGGLAKLLESCEKRLQTALKSLQLVRGQ